MDPDIVAHEYLSGWFFVDLVSSVPFDYIIVIVLSPQRNDRSGRPSKLVMYSRILHVTRAMSLLKFLRLSRMVRYLGHVEENYVSPAIASSLCRDVLVLVFRFATFHC